MKRTGAMLARGKSKQDYQTDPEFMRAVEKRFGKPRFDLAAGAKNAQCAKYFTKRQNALARPWPLTLCWLNPPYSNIAPWAKKCAEESKRGVRILFLVPASVGSNWYCDWCYPYTNTYLLNGRLTFVGQSDPYPKYLILCDFGGPGSHHCEPWAWQSEL